jgi:hypothetical protein
MPSSSWPVFDEIMLKDGLLFLTYSYFESDHPYRYAYVLKLLEQGVQFISLNITDMDEDSGATQ